MSASKLGSDPSGFALVVASVRVYIFENCVDEIVAIASAFNVNYAL